MRGDAQQNYNFGMLYLYFAKRIENDKGSLESSKEYFTTARNFFKKSADARYTDAQYQLGMLYLQDKVKPPDDVSYKKSARLSMAAGYLYLASEKSHHLAQYMLGAMYVSGDLGARLSDEERLKKGEKLQACALPTIAAAIMSYASKQEPPQRYSSNVSGFFGTPGGDTSPDVLELNLTKFKELEELRGFLAVEGKKSYLPEGVMGKPMAITNGWGDCAYAAITAGIEPAVFAKNDRFLTHLRERFGLQVHTTDNFYKLVDSLFNYDEGQIKVGDHAQIHSILTDLRGHGFKVREGFVNNLHVQLKDSYGEKLPGSGLAKLAKSGLVYQAFMSLALRTYLAERLPPQTVHCSYTAESGECMSYDEECTASDVIAEFQEPVVMGRLGEEFGFSVDCFVTEGKSCISYKREGADIATGVGVAAGGPDAAAAPGVGSTNVKPRLVVVRTGAGADAHYSAIPQHNNPRGLMLDVPVATPQLESHAVTAGCG